jgi:hypothetical protein
MAGAGGSKKIYIQIELLLYIDLVDWRAALRAGGGRYEMLSNLFSADNISCFHNTL